MCYHVKPFGEDMFMKGPKSVSPKILSDDEMGAKHLS